MSFLQKMSTVLFVEEGFGARVTYVVFPALFPGFVHPVHETVPIRNGGVKFGELGRVQTKSSQVVLEQAKYARVSQMVQREKQSLNDVGSSHQNSSEET